ncbi:MAG: helix-turn-helix domain-containing protein [Firmicutes bacterium]|nr:helix-turn-helix domain-containing protein [Bacillota bacterium]
MDQIKTGNFLKELRKAKNITQEELANHLNVSRKSVSRWETGTNMPDLDILIELSKFYDVNIDEILNGQKRENNEVNIDETVSNVAAISDNTLNTIKRRMHILFIIGFIVATIFMYLYINDYEGNFFTGLCLGIEYGMMIVGIIITSKYADIIRNAKHSIINSINKK